MFPEGERTYTGNLEAFKPGISLLIKRTKAPIIPAGIAGGYATFSRHRKFPHFPAVSAADGRDHRGLGRQADRPGEVRENAA